MHWTAPEPVGRVVFSPRGKFLATTHCRSDDDGGDVVRLWDAATGEEVAHLDGLEPVFSLAFASERSLVVVERSRCRLWNGREARNLRPSGHWHSGSATAEGKFIALAREREIEVLSLPGGALRYRLALPPEAEVWYDDLVAAGPYLAGICRADRERFAHAVLWDAWRGRRLRTYDLSGIGEAGPIAVHPSGEGVAVAGSDAVHVFGLEHEDPLDGFEPFEFDCTYALCYGPDGSALFALGSKSLVRLNAATGKRLAKWDVPKSFGWPDGAKERRAEAIDPSRGRAALAVDRTVILWEYD